MNIIDSSFIKEKTLMIVMIFHDKIVSIASSKD